MSWIEVSLDAHADTAEPVSQALERLGASAVTITPRDGAEILEPAPGAQPLARLNRVTGLFEASADPDTLMRELAQILGAKRAAHATVAPLPDARWENVWREHAAARSFGHGLWILPHDAAAPAGARAIVRLDPGLAFGTGAHPTTALCLEWLAGQDLAGRTVIDYGCGSGVLAIAAAVLGAKTVYAVDHDVQARDAAASNARANGVAGRVRLTAQPPVADVLVANILANTLADLAPRFAAFAAPHAALALSGILPQQADGLAERYSRWFAMDAPRELEGWVLLGGRRTTGDSG